MDATFLRKTFALIAKGLNIKDFVISSPNLM